MPRIPIPQQPPLALIDGGAETDGGPAPLPPETAAGLRTLAARTARIDRELAVSQSWLSGHERLARAEDAPQGPPSGFLRSFLQDADRDRETALKTELPDDAKDALGLDLLDLRATFADRAAEAEAEGLALRRRLSLHETLEGYRTGVARDPGLYDGAAERMTALVADLGLPEDRRADLTRHATDRLANAAVDGLMGDPERAERMLSEGLFDDALSEGSKALRLKEARDLSLRQRLLARESRVADLAAQASFGALAEDALTAAERDGALGPAEAARLREVDRAAVQAANLRDARIARVAQATDPFDPQDAEDRAAVSAYWDSVSEVHRADDPETQRRTELAFVDRTGVLPEGLRKRYQGELLSADAAVAVTGAETLAALAATNPALLADVPPAQVRRATTVAGFAELGLPPERAIELADAEMDRDDGPPDPEIPAVRIAANQNGDDAAPPGGDGNAQVLAALPDAISALLAEEGIADDPDTAASLTQITTAALAVGLPLTDETADALISLANGDQPSVEQAGLQFLTPIIKAVTEVGKFLGRLWRRLPRKERDGEEQETPRKPLPGPETVPLPQPGDKQEPETPSESASDAAGGDQDGATSDDESVNGGILRAGEPTADSDTSTKDGRTDRVRTDTRTEQDRSERKRERPPLVGTEEQESSAREIGLKIVGALSSSEIEFDETAAKRLEEIARDFFAETNRHKVVIDIHQLGPTISREQAIMGLVDAQRAGQLVPDGEHVVELDFGPIPTSVQESLLRRTKGELSVRGYRRTIDGHAIVHSFQRHGPGNESDENQSPISPEAMSMYLNIVEDPTSEVTLRQRPGRGTTTVRYEKRINGIAVVVEEIRTGKKTLAFTTMWIQGR